MTDHHCTPYGGLDREWRRGDVQGGEETLGDIEPDQGDNRRTAGVRFGGQSLQHKDGENEVAAETLSVQPPSSAYALLGNGYFCLDATPAQHSGGVGDERDKIQGWCFYL